MTKSKHIHGEGEVVVRGRIIIARYIGTFNEHGVHCITSEIKKSVMQMNSQPFAILIDDLKLSGGTPEAYAVLDEYNQWINTQNLVAKAMVITSKAHKAIMNKLSPSRTQQNIEYFTDENSALIWLESELKNHRAE